MKKNVASQVITAQLISKTDGSDVTSGTTTVYVLGDGGTQGAGGGTVTHEGNGCWSYVPTQAETNYDHVAFTFVNSSAVSVTVQVYTDFPQTGDNYTRLGAPIGASISADLQVVDGNVDTLVTRITSTLFSGITSLAEWLGLLAGKQTGNATARTEIRATGAGSGTFDETTDSQEAIKDAALTQAQVNAEVVDALVTDTYTEPGQAAPGVNISLKDKIGYLYKALRNKLTSDGSYLKLYADDGTTVDQKWATSEAAGTVTRDEAVTGP